MPKQTWFKTDATRPQNLFKGLFLVFALLLATLTACGGDTPAATEAPASQPEVVTFATQPPATATPVPPTNTPLPTPIPATPTPEPTSTPQPEPEGVVRADNENPLTGLVVDPQVFSRRPLHVRIGNDPGARPQVNLHRADVVYEELVEWWITRLTAVYYGEMPDMVAPIRSARLINKDLTQQYDAALLNSGGSDPVRWQLSQLPIVNLDEYFHPDPYFYRDGESWERRLAVNAAQTLDYLAENDMQAAVSLRGFSFDAEAPKGSAVADTIYINYPAKTSKVLWTYNRDKGVYERTLGGELHIDGDNDQLLGSENVIIYFTKHTETDIVEDSTGATSVDITLVGEGDAIIFRDGLRIDGRWRAPLNETPEFVSANGDPIPLKPGQTWIQVVPEDYDILVNETP